jgi:Uncharacterized conserved protein
MPVSVVCECSNSFSLKDEYAGRMVKCPSCGASVRAGTTEFTPDSQADPIFGRDMFLMRQQVFRVNERYDISDERGQPLLFVERPAHFLRNIGAVLASIAAAGGWVWLLILAAEAVGTGTLSNILVIIGAVGFVPIAAVVGMKLAKKRHVHFYTNADKTTQLLEVRQDQKVTFINATFTILDAEGVVVAQLRKNYLFNFFRRKWEVLSPGGTVEWVAREDSIIISLARRIVPYMNLLRTNFVFQRAGNDRVIGEFKRKFTILDRYVLDLTADPARAFDRRVAVALGVMLDTGERR